VDTGDSSDLLRRSTAGDRAAFDTLLARHLPGVRAFARLRMSPLLRAHESESDLVQSACRDVLAKAEGFEYRGEAAFRAWLYTAVLHKLRTKERGLRAQKRDARRRAQPGDAGDPLAACYAQVLSPSAAAMAAERVQALERAFDALPEHYREVISLSRIARLDRASVAAQMGRSEDSIRNLLHRALAQLAIELRQVGEEHR
jgi:RNA polymerase sigma factor (sigma-70 family)